MLPIDCLELYLDVAAELPIICGALCNLAYAPMRHRRAMHDHLVISTALTEDLRSSVTSGNLVTSCYSPSGIALDLQL